MPSGRPISLEENIIFGLQEMRIFTKDIQSSN